MRLLTILLLLGASCDGDPPMGPTALSAPADGVVVLEGLSEGERGPEEENGRRRIGAHRALPEALPGSWRPSENIWRVEIRSPGAVALRLHFTDFHLPGGSVVVYETDEALRPDRERRYEDNGPGGDGEFWSDLIEGESATVEYHPPSGEKLETPPFHIS